MTISIQMLVIVGVPFLLIYSTLILGIGYRKGFKEGFDLAKFIVKEVLNNDN